MGGGTCPSSNIYVWAEIHASFGQNIKIPEKLWYVRKNFCTFAKIINIRENFLICPENFLYVCRIYGLLGKIFLGCPGKKMLCPVVNNGDANVVKYSFKELVMLRLSLNSSPSTTNFSISLKFFLDGRTRRHVPKKALGFPRFSSSLFLK